MIYLTILGTVTMLIFSFIILNVIKNNRGIKLKIGLDFFGLKTYMEVDEEENKISENNKHIKLKRCTSDNTSLSEKMIINQKVRFIINKYRQILEFLNRCHKI